MKTVKLIGGHEPFLRSLLVDVRYEDGFLYVDRAGRIARKLTRSNRAIMLSKMDTNGTVMADMTSGAALTFSMNNVSYVIDRTSVKEEIGDDERDRFLKASVNLISLVLSELEVAEFTRIAFRQQIYFQFESQVKIDEWLRSLGLFYVDSRLSNAFAGTPEASSFAIVLKGSECRYRIGFQGVERNVQIESGAMELTFRESIATKTQRHHLLEAEKAKRVKTLLGRNAAVIDVEAFLQDPDFSDVEADLSDFIARHMTEDFDRIREVVSRK